MLAQKRTATRFLFLAGVLLSQVGCVALNIPSHRFHDASDHGGLFGDWRDGGGPVTHGATVSEISAAHGNSCELHGSSRICLDGGPLEVDPFDPTLDVNGNPKQPEIPWPRFFPVPTRPVFGAISQ